WEKLAYVGSFRMTNASHPGFVTMKIVRYREDGTHVIMNSANAHPIQAAGGLWHYNGQFEARCPPGAYDLLAVVGSTTQVGKTRVIVIEARNSDQKSEQ